MVTNLPYGEILYNVLDRSKGKVFITEAQWVLILQLHLYVLLGHA